MQLGSQSPPSGHGTSLSRIESGIERSLARAARFFRWASLKGTERAGLNALLSSSLRRLGGRSVTLGKAGANRCVPASALLGEGAAVRPVLLRLV
jgi:hypothetical protein